jgi:ABC-type uncharacterized transport system substrate-binding protein
LIDQQNIVVVHRWPSEGGARLHDIAADLVRLQVDVIVAPSTPAILAVKEATTTIPIVVVSPGDPVELGVIHSLARPGGNITGVTGIVTAQLIGKLVELIKDAVPSLGGHTWHARRRQHPPPGDEERRSIAGPRASGP